MNNDVPEVVSYSMAIIKVACEQQTHFRSSLLKCVCCSQALIKVVIAKLRVLENYMKEKKLCN